MQTWTKKGLLIGALLSTIASCVTQQAKLASYPLDKINHWTAKGKIGLKLETDSSSANFSWQNRNTDYAIQLHGPFGQGAVQLNKLAESVIFKSKDQELKATSAEELLMSNLGWSVPVSQLHWWIKGLASPRYKVDSSRRDDMGLLKNLQQQNWNITFKNYKNIGGHYLPHKLIAKQDQIRITLIIKSWYLSPPGQRG